MTIADGLALAPNASLSGYGTINADDYFLIDSAYIGQTAILSAKLAAVPEPAILYLLIPAAACALARRRRI